MSARRRAAFFAERSARLARARALVEELSLTSAAAARHGLPVRRTVKGAALSRCCPSRKSAFDRLRAIWPELPQIDDATAAQVEIDARYAVYLDRQASDIEAYRRDEELSLPPALDYSAIARTFGRIDRQAQIPAAAHHWSGSTDRGDHAGGSNAARGAGATRVSKGAFRQGGGHALCPSLAGAGAELTSMKPCCGRGSRRSILVSGPTLEGCGRGISPIRLRFSKFPEISRWADLGSGAGFPGMVLAILLKARAGRIVHLIESDQRKAAFLRAVSRETGAPAIIHVGRIE